MLKWKKVGKIFDPKLISNLNSHAQVPFGVVLEDCIRVYFTSRPPKDALGTYVSYIYFIDLEIDDLSKIKYIHKNPLLELGKPGSFDEFGTMPCSIVKKDDDLLMYYVGWSRMLTVPYNCANGLAISKDNGQSFQKYSEGPIMGQSIDNPYIVGCPRVYIFDGKFYMWYIGGQGWLKEDNRFESMYNIKLAISDDGISWKTINHDVISKKYESECQTSVSIFKYNNIYHMYFTYRHAVDFRNPTRGYRIGYAYSHDMTNWTRNDEISGIDISKEGWDSEMICYPYILNVKDNLIMFYCGNNFGINGFGYAILDNHKQV